MKKSVYRVTLNVRENLVERIIIMCSVKIATGKKYTINVVSSSDKKKYISTRDAEMDKRAIQAVKTAVEKAAFCKKPIAKYDVITKKSYVEYSDGRKINVE